MNRIENDNPMKIRISQLSSGLHEYHFSSKPSDVGLEENFQKDVNVDVVLDKTQRQIFLKVDIHTSGHFPCDRCLEDFVQPIVSYYNMLYVMDAQDADKNPVDEIQIISPETTYIELTEDVRQIVILSIPLKLICKDECKGLCSQCGANWNYKSCMCHEEVTDSRWEPLKNLLNN